MVCCVSFGHPGSLVFGPYVSQESSGLLCWEPAFLERSGVYSEVVVFGMQDVVVSRGQASGAFRAVW